MVIPGYAETTSPPPTTFLPEGHETEALLFDGVFGLDAVEGYQERLKFMKS